jgi:hypothetical protein
MIGGRKTEYDSSFLFLLIVVECHQKKKIIKRIESMKRKKRKKNVTNVESLRKNRCYKTKWSHSQNNASHAIYIRDCTLRQ